MTWQNREIKFRAWDKKRKKCSMAIKKMSLI